MSPPVGQTPGVLLLKPGDAGYDAACNAALKACGIDPDSFDSYTGRCNAIRAAGNNPAANAADATNLQGQDLQDFCTANAQSGHMAQNGIFQGRGARDDECGNVPPATFGDPTTPSSFGYSCGGAPCTDHFGTSTLGGSCHGEISRVTEKPQGWAERGVERNTSLNASQIEDQVRASARIHVDADRAHRARPAAGDDPAEVQRLANAQRANAARLSAGDPAATELLNPNGVDPAHPNGGGKPGPSDAVKDFAAECEVTKWKAMMTDMRANAINNSPVGQAARRQTGRPFTSLTPAQQRQVIANNPQLFGTPPPGAPPAAPLPNAAQAGVNPPPGTQLTGTPAGTPPTERACNDYQGNYLAWQMANSPGGAMPGWAGRAPAGAAPGSLPTSS